MKDKSNPYICCAYYYLLWYGGEIFENEDFSQRFLYSLLYIETCSLRKHCKDDSNEFMSYRKKGFLRGESFLLSPQEIGFKENILRHHRDLHGRDRPEFLGWYLGHRDGDKERGVQ